MRCRFMQKAVSKRTKQRGEKERPERELPTFGDVSAHRAVNAGAADAEKAANIPASPARVVLFAVDAHFVVRVLDKRAQGLGVGLGLRAGLGGARHDGGNRGDGGSDSQPCVPERCDGCSDGKQADDSMR